MDPRVGSGPRFGSGPRLTGRVGSGHDFAEFKWQVGSRVGSESTFKKSIFCVLSNTDSISWYLNSI